MPRIFISYRRADSRKDAGRIYDRLVEAFGKNNVFKDVDSIPMGRDFRRVLSEAVALCDVQLVIIGKLWLTIADENGKRRLDNAGDFVRVEVETGLQRDSCLVIPVLVDNATMPQAEDLPFELRELTFKNATVVRDDPDFHNDVSKIIRSLGGHSVGVAALENDKSFDVHAAISRFYRLFDEKDWDSARSLLAEIRSSGKAPRLFNIDAHEAEIWKTIETIERDKAYDLLRLMAQRPNKILLANALQEFWGEFPNYDPDQLGNLIKPTHVSTALKFRLVVRRGPKPGMILELEKDIITVGRDITNDFLINDPDLSRHHCRFTRGAGGFVLEDLGSTNGTFINGKRLTGARPLNPGDMIGFGETVTLEYQKIG